MIPFIDSLFKPKDIIKGEGGSNIGMAESSENSTTHNYIEYFIGLEAAGIMIKLATGPK